MRCGPTHAGVGRLEGVMVTVALLLLAVAFTWPLALHLSTDVMNSTGETNMGHGQAVVAPGDHLQLLYWCWLFGDSVREGRSPLTDPYEFHDGDRPAFFFQPSLLPLLTFLLSPLGLIASFNLVALLSFAAAGLATHLLLRLEMQDRLAAFAGALVFALLPYRQGQLVGHVYGFLAFLVPLHLYCVERSVREMRWGRWALAAGVTFFFTAPEYHLSFFLLLLDICYLPMRFFTPISDWLEERGQPLPPPSGWRIPAFAVLCAAAAGIWAYDAVDRIQHFSHPAGWIITPAIGAILGLFAWRLLYRTASRYTAPSGRQVNRACALPFAPLLLLAFTPLSGRLGLPDFAREMALAAGIGAIVLALPVLRLLAGVRPRFAARAELADRLRRFLANIGLTGLSLAYLLIVRRLIFAPSVAAGGRPFAEVRFSSPQPIDLLTASNSSVERFVYIGIVAAVLALVGLATLRQIEDRGRRARIAFFAGVAAVGLLLAVGPNTDIFPAYHLLYRTVPMFNFPRVSARILAVAIVGLAYLVAVGFTSLRQRAGRYATVLAAVLLSLLVADYRPRYPRGLITIPQTQPVYERLRNERRTGDAVLELPIWPGSAYYSSVYLWWVTRHRTPLVNGYSPAVKRSYVENVYKPLSPMNLGEMGRPQYDLLMSLGVRFVVFHEEFDQRASGAPAGGVLEKLCRSPYLETVEIAPPLVLFRLRPEL